jgi:putative polysaccharide biosynthesis protein
MDQQVQADLEATKQHYKGDIRTFFHYAAREAKKQPSEILKEIVRLSRGDGRLSIDDYFLYRLFEDERLSMADKEKFISDQIHWPISNCCNDPKWMVLTQDKWLSYTFMSACGIPTPDTLAVIDTSERKFNQLPKITKSSELRQFLSAQTSFPLFAKDNTGLGSFGAFVIAGIEGDLVLREHAEPIACDAVFTQIVGKRCYLLQRFVRNHPEIQGLSKYCATVRTINMVGSGRVLTPFALIKIPGPTSIADNYWRAGNIIANVELETGEICRAVTGKGIEMKELRHHPETGDLLIGKALPFWKELRTLNET